MREASNVYLIKISLEPVHFGLFFQETRPIFFFSLFLAQHEFQVTVGMVDLALLWVDFLVKLQLGLVGDIFGSGFALESDFGRLDI